MKITYAQLDKSVVFDNIKPGNTFSGNKDHDPIWMRIVDDVGGPNAVRLDNGVMLYWSPDDLVFPVNAKVVIE